MTTNSHSTNASPTAVVEMIDLHRLKVDPSNIRTTINNKFVTDLARMIKAAQAADGGINGSGVQRPLSAYKGADGVGYVLDGQLRLNAISLLQSDRGYTQVGVPVLFVDPPSDLWESTALQMGQHASTLVSPLDLVERAVELKNVGRDGKPATWDMVARVMGGDKATWSLHQHILGLVPELKDMVAAGEFRPRTAAIVGRDLTVEQQRQYLEQIVTHRTREPALRALIQAIQGEQAVQNRIAQANAYIPDLDNADIPDTDNADTTPTMDAEASYHARVIRNAIALLNKLPHHRLAGLSDEFMDLGQMCQVLADRSS